MTDSNRALPGPAEERSLVLEDFLREASHSRWGFAKTLIQGRVLGWPMAELLFYVVPAVEGTRWEEATGRLHADCEANWIAELVSAIGSVDEAQQLVTELEIPGCWGREDPEHPLDLRVHYDASPEAMNLRQRLVDQVAGRAPLPEIAQTIAHPLTPDWVKVPAWVRALKHRPLAEVLQSPEVPPEARNTVIATRGSVWDRLMDLFESVDVDTFVELGAEVTGYRLRAGTLIDQAVDLLLRGAMASDISRWEVIRLVPNRGDASRWLPVFRKAGFTENAAALACVESGLSLAKTAEVMVASGYSDGDTLRGIRSTGVGIERALRAFAADGWPRSRLISAMEANEALAPEIWEMLRTL